MTARGSPGSIRCPTSATQVRRPESSDEISASRVLMTVPGRRSTELLLPSVTLASSTTTSPGGTSEPAETVPEPAGYGASCTGPNSCVSGLCVFDPVGNRDLCSEYCEPEQGQEGCPHWSTCEKTDQEVAVCMPIRDPSLAQAHVTGGCAVPGRPGVGGAFAFFLGLLTIACRRRRR